ncbi:c-type cytochrome [Sulfurimonas sp. SAG-AH-194-I05]|nr:cytochrome c peroxidase [Sulfurimonas sp. SAG-AH-194-I05]MDF1875030.1 c-type cytochrome [Sulfurimonas sp. SAG-AH-194-I05]
MITTLGKSVLIASLLLVSLEATEDMKKWLRPAEVPQPENNKLTPERIELGKFLYFDVRLSSSEKISCATCHHPKKGWSDLIPTPKAVGHEGRVGPRNSPVILNAAYQSRQFWDGRARTLEDQALGPIEADVEMNMPLDELIPKLNAIKGYVALFEKAYPGEGLTQETLAKAIASFERTVVSTISPFDKYALGDKNALSKRAKIGFELFKGKAHCIDCHDGFNFTDGSFHNIGLRDGELNGKDLGRYLNKRRAAWYGVMKTPTLRDAAKSAPYFHDGSAGTLHEVVHVCGNGGRFKHNVKNKSTYIVDRGLTRSEISKLVSFIGSLTGPDMKLKVPTKFPQ